MISYVSPADGSTLTKDVDCFRDGSGNIFGFVQGVPNFIYPQTLPQSDMNSLSWYKEHADTYDEYLPLTFETFNVNEDIERQRIIARLDLKVGQKVLETGCGTGRDSLKIAEKIGGTGELFLQDISYDILKHAIRKFENIPQAPRTHFALANGYYLPFGDSEFDRVFHFGGFNTFGDRRRAMSEMARVTKPGGRIVVGDESMPIWLRNTEFGRVLMHSNPHYEFELPLAELPVSARNVSVEWIIGGVFYLICFTKGDGVPFANLDFPIPGARGGTHRTRYYGKLEGVSPAVVALAKEARAARGVSMFDWLEEAIRFAAMRDTGKK